MYSREDTNAKQWSHPVLIEILEKVNQLSDIKYAIYRMAYKIKTLQDYLKGEIETSNKQLFISLSQLY